MRPRKIHQFEKQNHYPKFCGRLEYWNTSYEFLRILIQEDEYSDDLEKMISLMLALRDDALQIVQNMPQTSTGYETALETLQQRYGNIRSLFTHYLDKIFYHHQYKWVIIVQHPTIVIHIRRMHIRNQSDPILTHLIFRK